MEGFYGSRAEEFGRGGVAVSRGGEGAGSCHFKTHGMFRGRLKRAVFVNDGDGDECEVFSIGREFGPVGGKRESCGGGGCADCFAGELGAVRCECNGCEFARLIDNVVPDKPPAGFAARADSCGFAVEEKFDAVEVRIDVDGRVEPFAPGPGPVREDVENGHGGPACAVEPCAVFGEPGEVVDSEVGCVRGPVSVVGGGFAEIIEAGPDEFAEDPFAGVLHFEFAVGGACPRREFEVVGGALEIFMETPFGSGFDGEEVFAARADCGRRFAAVLRDMRVFRVEFGVAVRLVVPADDVERGRKVVFHRVVGAVESGCDGTGRVGGVCDGGKFRSYFPSVRLALFVDFVADAPHDDRGVIAVAADQVDEVALVPFGED